ncbi:MAG TPA: hypothetical protein VFE08_03130 [Candidatus Sulfotelmatobacter sp.]|nr:hypothetical protein [Candidatus Sulfotelmatobacter sp.]
MKPICLLLLFAALAVANTPEPAIAYFSNLREVHVVQPDRQNFFIVDEEIWNHSRPDLGDLRLYAGQSPIQYSLSEQRAGISSEEVEAKLLNLGSVAGHTEFDIDAENLSTYDRIRLRLGAKDFVATASVAGSNTLGEKSAIILTPSTLYDFTSQQLGSNFVLKLPPSSFRYLHVKLSSGILPLQVKGAAIFNLREQLASWTKTGSCSAPQQNQRTTVIACSVSPRVPMERIAFQLAPGQANFRRTVSVLDLKGTQEASGEINRVRINRAGTLVNTEELAIGVVRLSGQFTIAIDNGDNPPLSILEAQPLSLERRIYFDPQGKASLALYYGDEKLSVPVYDYARFFHLETSAAEAQLGTGVHNPLYTGRPDDRPWSDRHMGILWAVMILAVLALSALAVRGLRSEARD